MDLDYIESLAELVRRSTVKELTVRAGERRITLRRSNGEAIAASELPPPPDPTAIRSAPGPEAPTALLPAPRDLAVTTTALVPAEPVGGSPTLAEPTFTVVKAHRVGIFHRAADEGGAPLVSIGDQVGADSHLGSIESMRLYDEVIGRQAGRVVGIFVADGEPVEYGQPLFHLQTGAGPEAPQPASVEEVEA